MSDLAPQLVHDTPREPQGSIMHWGPFVTRYVRAAEPLEKSRFCAMFKDGTAILLESAPAGMAAGVPVVDIPMLKWGYVVVQGEVAVAEDELRRAMG